MNIDTAQDVIYEIEAICKKHGVALIGKSEDSFCAVAIIGLDNLDSDAIDHLSTGDRPYKHDGITLVNGIC